MGSKSDNLRPVVGISMGDPAGIGPEIIVKAALELRRTARFVIHGANDLLTLAADRCGIDPFWQRVPADNASLVDEAEGDVIVRDHDHGGLLMRLPTEPSRRGGHASKQWVDATIADAMLEARPTGRRRCDGHGSDQQARGISPATTGRDTPNSSPSTRSRRTAMCFESPRLRVILATVHVPLMELRNLLTIGRVFDPIDLGHQACRQLGIAAPRIAVAGLNPHAGEQGLMGDEEQRIIAPAVRMARDAGIDAHGPFPADSVFREALDGRWDMVVAMYHDQGLIPMKLVQHGTSVNWTVGLPIIRTSPDHGTAYDIAGTGRADAGSMESAIRLAVHLAANRRRQAAGS